MKFYCDNCHAKYSISDEKVRGKVLKVRCKKCSNVITVREPRAPEAKAPQKKAPPRPPAPQQIAWYYAINGQSFGPYEADTLREMIASGEVGDAAYIWQEGFGSTWKPVRDVPTFAPALTEAEKVRPRKETIGVSGAMEAVDVEDSIGERDEEEGVAPGASPQKDVDGDEAMNQRLQELRDKLKRHDSSATPSKKAKKNPFDTRSTKDDASDDEAFDEDATVQMDFLSLRDGFAKKARDESSAQDASAPSSEDEEEQGPAPGGLDPAALFDEDSPSPDMAQDAAVDDDSFELTPEEAPLAGGASEGAEELMPSFEGMSAPDESVIDFSRLEKKTDDDDTFAESELKVSEEDKKNEESAFVASNSLLIQLDAIQKEGRGKRALLGVAAVLLIGVVGASAIIISSMRQPEEKKPESNLVFEEQKKELVMKKYSPEERSFLFELDQEEEVITAEEAEQAAKEVDAMEEGKPAPAAKARPEPREARAPRTKKTTPAKDDPLRGVGSLLNDDGGGGLDDAMADSKRSGGKSKSGLNTGASEDESAGAAGQIGSGSKPRTKTGTDWEGIKSKGRSSGGPSKSLAARLRDKKSDDEGGPQLGQKGLLSSDAAKKGFRKIRRSVASCHQRQVTRGLPLSSAKVHVTVEIQNSGKVSSVKLSPASFKHSEFESCMQEARRMGRWTFDSFTGKPAIKIRHTYVLQ